jgi:DNA-binding GntR family transcriptional regulator
LTTATKMVVQGVRLRDQVYDIIREELKTGGLKPGQRLYENQLAAKYGVSRTPVREALFQLAREGLLVGGERSFSLPVDTLDDLRNRIEVHILIGPALARHAANDGTDVQVRSLTKFYADEKRAHQIDKFSAFAEANYQFRKLLRTMCRNIALAKCSAVLEDQFLFARNEIYRLAENRAIALDHDGRILKAIQARDPDLAARVSFENATALAERYANWPPEEASAPAAVKPPKAKRKTYGKLKSVA